MAATVKANCVENGGDSVNENRILFITRCPEFYKMEEQVKKVPYDDRDLREMAPMDVLRSGFKKLKIAQTIYDRVPLKNMGVGKRRPGFHDTTIKFFRRLGSGSNVFFFVYNNYANKFNEYEVILKKHCEVLHSTEEFRVSRWEQVQLAGLFGIKSKFGNIFFRVRIVQINRNTMQITYWAVDEGFFGECEPNHLIFLNDNCVALEMLVVPGVFDSDPTPAQLQKFQDGKHYCLAQVMQPKLRVDSAPRKVVLTAPRPSQ